MANFKEGKVKKIVANIVKKISHKDENITFYERGFLTNNHE